MVQINVRFDEDTVAVLDDLAAGMGVTRAEVVRDAVARRVQHAAADRIGAAYRHAYTEQPETSDDMSRAERAAHRLTSDEPWEPWW